MVRFLPNVGSFTTRADLRRDHEEGVMKWGSGLRSMGALVLRGKLATTAGTFGRRGA